MCRRCVVNDVCHAAVVYTKYQVPGTIQMSVHQANVYASRNRTDDRLRRTTLLYFVFAAFVTSHKRDVSHDVRTWARAVRKADGRDVFA